LAADLLLLLAIPLVYGFAKSCTDLRRDAAQDNYFYHIAQEYAWFNKFYYGLGNYSQRFPWDQDFWHFWDDVKLLALVVAVVIAPMAHLPIWVFPLPMYWLAGRFFSLFYSYVLPDHKRGTIWDWMVRSILFWIAENK
jgi:hypothetical protein